MKVSKYSLLALLYFFFNSFLLPKGLLYTLLLSPIFFVRQLLAKRRTYALAFVCTLFLFDLVHLYYGVDLPSFAISNAFFICVYFFTVSLWHFIKGYEGLPRIFAEVLLCNGVLMLAALAFFFGPRQYQEWFWYFNKLTKGFNEFPRLAMFTYEASYYALLMAPVCVYYVLKALTGQLVRYRFFTLALAIMPLILSFSFGVIGALLISAFTLMLLFIPAWYRSRKKMAAILSLVFAAGLGLGLLYVFDPGNVLFVRIANIMTGADTSARGRTSESFEIAWKVAESKSIWFGAGLGQVKVVIADVVRRHYNYWGVLPRYDIPNAMAETLAIFGIAGVAIRLLLQLWLFRTCRVHTNLYALTMFVFLFVYQFTGSFITNSVEYAIWVLIFAVPFRGFDFEGLRGKNIKGDVQEL